MSAVPPSSPSRRHFIGIAAAAARKLSMISLGSSALSLLGTRDAAAGAHEQHHHWHDRSHRHREFGDVGRGQTTGSGQGAGSSSSGQAGGSRPRSGAGGGSGPAGGGSGSASGSGSANSGSGSANGGAGSGNYGSGSGSGSGTGSNSSGSGSGVGTGYGTGSSATGSGGGYGAGSGGYGSASGYGSGSGGVRCFTRGTLILTTEGEVVVERLAVGTEIVTASGPKPVKWIGRQTLRRPPSATWHPRLLPVRISQFAIDDCTPCRDVVLSQDHSLFVDGALIPARHLVNGHSIRFDERALELQALEYFHVELDAHEVIYADGLPVESFLYSGGTIAWDNLEEYVQRYGEHSIMAPLAPIHSYEGGFDELRGLMRLAASHVVDVRDPIQIAHDRLKERALLRAA